MIVLMVGNFLFEMYERAFADAFVELGHDVDEFRQSEYFTAEGGLEKLYRKFQDKYHIGPCVRKMNKDLVKKCQAKKYDLVFIYRGVMVWAETIRKIRQNGAVVMGYNNDDPFGKEYASYFWKIYLKAVKEYDYVFAFRKKNIEEYRRIGYQKTELLRAYYIGKRNFYIENCDCDKYKTDVIFIGHYEDDGREECMHALIDNGIDFKLYGDRWDKSRYYQDFCAIMGGPIHTIMDGKEYNLAVNSCKIAVVFLSKRNNDTYTRRCFEIPATRRMMLCEYTKDMDSMFKADEEAVYFNTKEEFITKVKYYLENEQEQKRIAEHGYQRLIQDGHEVKDRVRQIEECYRRLQEKMY